MRGTARRGDRARLAALGLTLGLVALAAPAAADDALWIRWTHPAPETVASFNVHLGSMPGVYDEVIAVGLPPRDGEGAYGWSLGFDGKGGRFVAISAVGHDGQQSALSNIGYFRSPALEPIGRPGQPRVEP